MPVGKILQSFTVLDSVWQWEWAADRDRGCFLEKEEVLGPVDQLLEFKGSSWAFAASILTKFHGQMNNKCFSTLLPVNDKEVGSS